MKETRGKRKKPTVKSLAVLVLSCTVLLLQTGCWDLKIYENIGFILQMGLERNPDEKLLYTVSIPAVGPDIQGKVQVLFTTDNLLRESREKIRQVAGKAVEGGKTQHIYFSRQLAQKGIKRQAELTLGDRGPQVDFKLDLKASLDEFNEAHNLDNPEAKRKLEEAIAQSFSSHCMRVLKYLQEVGSDPLGIREMLRVKYNDVWKTMDRDLAYKSATFHVETDLVFEFHGAIH